MGGPTKQRLLETAGRFKWLGYIVAALILAAGFDFRTPQAQFTELRAQDVQLHQRIDSVIRADQQDSEIIRALGIQACLSSNQRELQLMQLPCSRLLNEIRR